MREYVIISWQSQLRPSDHSIQYIKVQYIGFHRTPMVITEDRVTSPQDGVKLDYNSPH